MEIDKVWTWPGMRLFWGQAPDVWWSTAQPGRPGSHLPIESRCPLDRNPCGSQTVLLNASLRPFIHSCHKHFQSVYSVNVASSGRWRPASILTFMRSQLQTSNSPRQGVKVQVPEGRRQGWQIVLIKFPSGACFSARIGRLTQKKSILVSGLFTPRNLGKGHFLHSLSIIYSFWNIGSISKEESPLLLFSHVYRGPVTLWISCLSLLKEKKPPLFIFCGLFEYNDIGGIVTGNIFLADLFCYVSILHCAQPGKLRKQMLPALRKPEEELFSEPPACYHQWEPERMAWRQSPQYQSSISMIGPSVVLCN